jgi:hypothetical protein
MQQPPSAFKTLLVLVSKKIFYDHFFSYAHQISFGANSSEDSK